MSASPSGSVSRDIVVGTVMCLFGLVAAVASWRIGETAWGAESARLFPLTISLAIAILGIRQVVEGRRPGAPRLDFGPEASAVIGLTLIAVLYLLAIGTVGYLLATGAAAAATLRLFGVRSWLGLIAAAIICPVLYYFVFFVLLEVYPPHGSWFDLLDYLPAA